MAFRTPLQLMRTGSHRWTLTANLVYDGEWDTFVVPTGFVTDFATVPRIVQWLVPTYGKYTLAAVLHDWLCTVGIETKAISSTDADGIFRRVMRELDVPWLQRWLMWAGVRWGSVFNRKRRPGVLRDMPKVLALSLVALPVTLPGVLGVAVGLGLFYTLVLLSGG